MNQIKIQYLGKKKGVQVGQGSHKITLTADPIWVSEADYKWLTELNPKMFAKLDEKSFDENLPAIIEKVKEPKPEPKIYSDGDFKCDKCGADFKVKWTYERHIKKCTGPDQE